MNHILIGIATIGIEFIAVCIVSLYIPFSFHDFACSTHLQFLSEFPKIIFERNVLEIAVLP